jgi:cytochrome bd-type quinol oxidase subunit 2
MFRKLNKRSTLISGAIAGILFCIPAFIYIRSANYEQSWMLYMGSFLFMIVIWVHTMLDSKKRDDNESTVALVFASHMATIVGIIISCLISCLAFLFLDI